MFHENHIFLNDVLYNLHKELHIRSFLLAEKRAAQATGEAEAKRIEAQGRADAVTIEAKAQAVANKSIAESLTPNLLNMQQIEVQGKFNEALRENKDAKIFLTPGGSTPNIWVDTKDKSRDAIISK